MIGAIIGDINGSVYEFRNIRTKDFQIFNTYMYFTDDSVLTIAVMKTINDFFPLESKDINDFVWQERFKSKLVENFLLFAKKYPTCGFGGRFYDWCKSRDDHKPYNSYGNGSAMRVSPIAYIANSEEEVILLSRLVTEVTHNHPEGIKGAEATALAVYLALKGVKRKDIVSRIAKEYYPEIESFDYEDLRKNYTFNESCQGTVPQAIYCFGISKDFEDCVRNTISIGGDCDTSAAISCAVAGAYDGYSRDFRYLAFNFLDDDLIRVIKEFEQNIDKIGHRPGYIPIK